MIVNNNFALIKNCVETLLPLTVILRGDPVFAKGE